jgi:hypothetical protein
MPWNGWLWYYKNPILGLRWGLGVRVSLVTELFITSLADTAPSPHAYFYHLYMRVRIIFRLTWGPHLPHGAPLTLLDRRGWIHSVHLTVSWTLEGRKEHDLFTANVRYQY